ncbi:hypothetical protein ACS3KU_004220 [Escherichia coli]
MNNNNDALKMRLTSPFPSLADAICSRTGYRGITQWVNELEVYFSLDKNSLLPALLKENHSYHIQHAGLILTFSHPHAVYTTEGNIERWILRQCEFIFNSAQQPAWLDTPPYNLNIADETPESIPFKLSDDITELNNSLTQSYYLNDGHTVAVKWLPAMKGIEKIIVVKLGTDSNFHL